MLTRTINGSVTSNRTSGTPMFWIFKVARSKNCMVRSHKIMPLTWYDLIVRLREILCEPKILLLKFWPVYRVVPVFCDEYVVLKKLFGAVCAGWKIEMQRSLLKHYEEGSLTLLQVSKMSATSMLKTLFNITNRVMHLVEFPIHSEDSIFQEHLTVVTI